jgi:hypothetical protein
MTGDPLRESRNTGTFVALIGLALASLFLIGLSALVFPQVLGIVIVVGVFFGAVAFHYVAWGWWLPKVLKDPDAPKHKPQEDPLPPWAVRKDE